MKYRVTTAGEPTQPQTITYLNDAPPHLKALEEIKREGASGLVEMLREEGIDVVRYLLWDATGWHRDYSPPAWRNQEQRSTNRSSTVYYPFHEPLDWQIRLPQGVGEPEKSLTYLPA